MSERVGIIGGSFDPVHLGHLIIARDALEQFKLDRILFVPAYQSPLKSKAPSASSEQRMDMLTLALDDNDAFSISDVDYRNPSISYSVRTASTIAQEIPDASLHWVLGADQIEQLHLWREIETLGKLVEFIAFERPGFAASPSPELPPNVKIRQAPARQLDISSSEIRDRLKSGRDAKYFLPEKVFDYIKAHNLYS